MKIHIVSDLHLHRCWRLPGPDPRVAPADADVLLLAGDIDRLDRVAARYADWPYDVLYVRGNHDSYGMPYESAIRSTAAASVGRFTMLERTAVYYEDARFLGCVLWTDFALAGDQDNALFFANFLGNDRRFMLHDDGSPVTAEQTYEEHIECVAWLENELSRKFAGATVVITHHAPHRRSLDPEYGLNTFSAAFASDLTRLMSRVTVWVHGHVHRSCSYKIRRCRIVCNPAGAQSKRNPKFEPGLVIEV